MSNSTIDSQHLRIYVTLARTQNMSRAAEELRMTPSGVSHGLKTLEADLGCRLFNRSSRKFEISPAGREFLAEAEQILEQMKNVRGKLKAWNDWRQGQLFIGANGTACQFLLPPTLREFRESFPATPSRSNNAPPARRSRCCWKANSISRSSPKPTEHSPQHRIQFDRRGRFAVHRQSAAYLGGQRKVQREDIPNRKLILPERGGNTYALIESYFRVRKHPHPALHRNRQ